MQRLSLTTMTCFALFLIFLISPSYGRYSKSWTQVDLSDLKDPRIKPSKYKVSQQVWINPKGMFGCSKVCEQTFRIFPVQRVSAGETPAFHGEILREMEMQLFRTSLMVRNFITLWTKDLHSYCVIQGFLRDEVWWENWPY